MHNILQCALIGLFCCLHQGCKCLEIETIIIVYYKIDLGTN